jgi:two-component system sensor kinase
MFVKSLAVADRQGARYERAKTLLALGELGQELAWPEADAQVSDARATLRELDCMARQDDELRIGGAAKVSLSLVDRFEGLLDTGRRIASALSAQTIYAEVCQAALRLLRGEHCAVLQVTRQDGVEQLHLIARDLPGGFHRAMALRALNIGRTVTFTEDLSDDGRAGDQDAIERISLCAPVFVRGRPLACLYVTHPLVPGLFGPDEERVADFIATLAGAALENAEGFEQLQQLNETLEQRVAERIAAAEERARELALSNAKLERMTTELRQTDEQLRLAKDAAEMANRAKSMFLATMSHEIRTPLTGVLGFTELLLSGADDDDVSRRMEYLLTIQTCGKHLLCLINDILDLSKIEAGQVEFERLACAPGQLIREVTSLLRVKAIEKGLTLEAQWASPLPAEIQTDPARVRQLLMNLVGNAIKFTERGAVRLVAEVTTRYGEPCLKFDVIDSGIGISADKLESIFDPFVQADNSITRRFGGTGLGLTISRRLARGLGGDLTVRSEVGKGSTFTVYFPTGPLDQAAASEAPVEDHAALHAAAPARWSSANLQGACILLVEDGDINRKLVTTVLRRAGADVQTAENGQLGVERALAGSFDLILMDMQMPVKDGYTAARELRSRGLATPIVALTAHAMNGDEEKCRQAGCSAYLTKPIEAEALLVKVASLIGDRSGGESTGAAAAEPIDYDAPLAASGEAKERLGSIVSTLPEDDLEFREIIEEFVEQLHLHLEGMRRALAQRDFQRVKERAHWLKGTGGMAGFDVLRAAALRLEHAAMQGQSEAASDALDDLVGLADCIVLPWRNNAPSVKAPLPIVRSMGGTSQSAALGVGFSHSATPFA